MERTFVLVKPGAVARGLVGEIITRFEHRGFRIRAMKFLELDRSLAEKHYAEHREKDFFGDLVSSITSGPVAAFVLEGPEAISVVRKMMGGTNPLAAEPGTIRGDYGLDIEDNIVHGSDGTDSAEREISLYFDESEIVQLLILASKSLQRKALLEVLGTGFEVMVPDYREEDLPGESPAGLVERHSRSKALSVLPLIPHLSKGSAVLGVDTMVVVDGAALGKARDEKEALVFLRRLSGKTHLVYSGLTLLRAGEASEEMEEKTAHVVTVVRFCSIPEAELESYVGTGEWRGRAGAYAIQGLASAFVEGVNGDYTNVVGLPVPLLVRMLREWDQWPPNNWRKT